MSERSNLTGHKEDESSLPKGGMMQRPISMIGSCKACSTLTLYKQIQQHPTPYVYYITISLFHYNKYYLSFYHQGKLRRIRSFATARHLT